MCLISNVQGFFFFFTACILLFLTLRLLMTSWRYGMDPLKAAYCLKNGAAQPFQRIFTALSTHWHYSLTVTSSSANQASPFNFQVSKYFCISNAILYAIFIYIVLICVNCFSFYNFFSLYQKIILFQSVYLGR